LYDMIIMQWSNQTGTCQSVLTCRCCTVCPLFVFVIVGCDRTPKMVVVLSRTSLVMNSFVDERKNTVRSCGCLYSIWSGTYEESNKENSHLAAWKSYKTHWQ
jgi:hypothetical protein